MKASCFLISLFLSFPIYASDGQKIYIKNSTQKSRKLRIGFVESGIDRCTKIKLDQYSQETIIRLPINSIIRNFMVFNPAKDEYSGVEHIAPNVEVYKNHRFYIYQDPGSFDIKIAYDIFND